MIIRCPDCHQPGDIYWVDVSQIKDGETMVHYGRTWCRTPGCVREGGWFVGAPE